jgi:nitrite reductase/ring-hydroxylating ferredoxin subunit
MAQSYRAVGWNRFKLVYDAWAVVIAAAFAVAFILASLRVSEPAHPVQLAMRASGATAFLMLTLTLCIGPLARFSSRIKPLLYNRRHLGVLTFLIALVHAVLTTLWYFGFSAIDPLTALLTGRPPSASASAVPFELFGLLALLVLFAMAATSHDHWLKALTPPVWKWLHTGVYAAYGLLVAHIAFGALQVERDRAFAIALLAAAGLVAVLHVSAGVLESLRERRAARMGEWLDAGPAAEVPDNRAVIVAPPSGERIAVYRFKGRLYGLAGVCPHQNGPLGEGRIVDGCVTCPWHGWQYRPTDGRSPPPFDEQVAVYPVRIEAGRALVRAQPLPLGDTFEGAPLEASA